MNNEKINNEDKKEKYVLDLPRLVICLGALIIGFIYYYVFDLIFDIAPYDARLTDTAVFMNFEKNKMNMEVYMFYENKNKSRERKQLLLFPIILNDGQKKPERLDFKEKNLPENFSLEKIMDEPNFCTSNLDNIENYTPLTGELTDYGARIWLKMGPGEKKVIQASFSQEIIKNSSNQYKFFYDFSNSKGWGIDLNNVYYFIYLPEPEVITWTDIKERKNVGEKFNYYGKYNYPAHLCKLGQPPLDGRYSYKDKKEIIQPCVIGNQSLYIIQYKKGFDPGIGFQFEDNQSLYDSFKKGDNN